MGRYLEIAKRVLAEQNAKRAAGEASATVVDVPPEVSGWPVERQELWAERAAVLEVDAGLPPSSAELEAVELCRPTPAGPWDVLHVGDACPACRRHLYVERGGRLECDRCLRKGRLQ